MKSAPPSTAKAGLAGEPLAQRVHFMPTTAQALAAPASRQETTMSARAACRSRGSASSER